MPYALRNFRCIDCGHWCQRRRPVDAEVRCARCAIEYSAEVCRQLHEHAGPAYERWAWAWAAGVRRAAPKIPLTGERRTA